MLLMLLMLFLFLLLLLFLFLPSTTSAAAVAAVVDVVDVNDVVALVVVVMSVSLAVVEEEMVAIAPLLFWSFSVVVAALLSLAPNTRANKVSTVDLSTLIIAKKITRLLLEPWMR